MWSDKAIEAAAHQAYDRIVVGGDGWQSAREEVKNCWRNYMRAALNAAAAVDGDAQWNAAIEEAAKWHDARAANTPDVFEAELHEVSAAAIRSLKRT